MSNVEIALRRLIEVLDNVGKPVAANINPGLTQQDIMTRCQQVNVTLPSELVELYCYCDGMKPSLLSLPDTGEYGLEDFYLLLPLDEALKEYEKVLDVDKALQGSERINRISSYDASSFLWFPFLGEGGDLYLVDAAAEMTEPSVIWWGLEFSPVQKYCNLSAMFNTLADAYEAGAYEYSYNLPYLNENLQMSLIARQRNPGVSYWQDRVQELSVSSL